MKIELRCSSCNKKIAVCDITGIGTIETKCSRCGHVDNHSIFIVPSKQNVEGRRSPSSQDERRV